MLPNQPRISETPNHGELMKAATAHPNRACHHPSGGFHALTGITVQAEEEHGAKNSDWPWLGRWCE
jgi:hypothetical protein